MLNAISIMPSNLYFSVYGPEERQRLSKLLNIHPDVFDHTPVGSPELLRETDVLVTGWGGPRLDEEFLSKTPNLKLVLYGGGTIRGIVTDLVWERGIQITNARAANAIPVSEYTLGAILLSLKHFWKYSRLTRQTHSYPTRDFIPGAYGTTVGLISLGAVGRVVLERLRTFDLNVLVYDPTISESEARQAGVELVSLDELFARSEVVSLHAPSLPETRKMIKGSHFRSMKEGATFINTARGAVVDEDEMITVLVDRPDIQAILDVTLPEPPVPTSPLYDLPNVIITPHIGGAIDYECGRMGKMVVDELERFLAGKPLVYGVTQEIAPILA